MILLINYYRNWRTYIKDKKDTRKMNMTNILKRPRKCLRSVKNIFLRNMTMKRSNFFKQLRNAEERAEQVGEIENNYKVW